MVLTGSAEAPPVSHPVIRAETPQPPHAEIRPVTTPEASAGFSPVRGYAEMLRATDPAVLDDVPVQIVTGLVGAPFMENQILNNFGGDRQAAVNALGKILSQPDAADTLLDYCRRPDYYVQDPHDATKRALSRWLPETYRSLTAYRESTGTEPSEAIARPSGLRRQTESDRRARYPTKVGVAAAHTTDPRERRNLSIAETIAQKHGIDIYVATAGPSLQELTPEAGTMFVHALEAGLNLTENDPEARGHILDSAATFVREQEKWWQYGQGMRDPVSERIMETIDRVDPVRSARIRGQLIIDKLSQDRYILDGLAQTDQLGMEIAGGQLGEDITRIARADRETARATAATILNTSDLPIVYQGCLLSHRELFGAEIPVAAENTIGYFGREYRICGLPEGEKVDLHDIQYGVIAATNGQHELVGMYVIPETAENGDTLRLLSPSEVLRYRPYAQPIPGERASAFVADFPVFVDRLSRLADNHIVDAVNLPAASLYNLWDQYTAASPDRQQRIENFIQKHGHNGIFAFLSTDYGTRNLDSLLTFTEHNDIPVSDTDLGFERVRLWRSNAEEALRAYNLLSGVARDVAARMSDMPERQAQITDVLLTRVNAVMITGAKLSEEGPLSREEWHFMSNEMRFHGWLFELLADPTNPDAREMNISYDRIRELYFRHDPADPEAASCVRSAFDAWFARFQATQGTDASYAGRTDRINSAFYDAYTAIERDESHTTVARKTELARYTGSIDSDIANGRFAPHPDGSPTTVVFVGMGNGGRIEQDLMKHMRERLGDGIRFVGVDPVPPTNPPDGVDYVIAPVTGMAKHVAHQADRMYSIASPLMDVLELSDWHDVADNIATSLRDGGIAEIDCALPFGWHSYETAQRAYHAAHPNEPEGMFYRSFHIGDASVGKQFFGPDPVFFQLLFSKYGLTCTNLPKNPEELSRMLTDVSAHREELSPDHPGDVQHHPFYRVPQGWPRMTLRFEKTGDRSADVVLFGSSQGKRRQG